MAEVQRDYASQLNRLRDRDIPPPLKSPLKFVAEGGAKKGKEKTRKTPATITFPEDVLDEYGLPHIDFPVEIEGLLEESARHEGNFSHKFLMNSLLTFLEERPEEREEYRAAVVKLEDMAGNEALSQRNYLEAIRCFQVASTSNPKNAVIRAKLAKSYHLRAITAGDTEEEVWKLLDQAAVLFDEAIRLDPYSAYAWNNRGQFLRTVRDFDRSLECFNSAITLRPDYVQAWQNKGEVLDLLGRHKEAMRCLNGASRA